MIKTLIFDFGDVFINLNKQGAMQHALNLFNIDSLTPQMLETNINFEVGNLTSEAFLEFYTTTFPNLSKAQILHAWNFIIKDFPTHRLQFIKALAAKNNYKLILLSNTNALHIKYIKEQVAFYEDFKNCFHKFYLSHQIKLRKPNANIYKFVLEENIKASECLFIDDLKENTDAAKALGFKVWNINPNTEDVVNLFTAQSHLF